MKGLIEILSHGKECFAFKLLTTKQIKKNNIKPNLFEEFTKMQCLIWVI